MNVSYTVLGSWIKPREHAIIGLVPWNILLSFTFTSAIFEYIISVPQALIMMEAQIRRSVMSFFFMLVFVFFSKPPPL